MRFLHLGDLHLGKSLGDFDLIEDQKYIGSDACGDPGKDGRCGTDRRGCV